MADISTLRLKWLRLFGGMPSTAKLEARHLAQRENDERLRAYMESKEFVRFTGLEDRMLKGETLKEEEIEELEGLRESFTRTSDYKWYEKQIANGSLDRVRNEKELFFDDFTGGKLNGNSWSTRFFWGDAMLGGKPYSFVGDPHGYTDGKNVKVQDSCLVIETRREGVDTLAWDSKLGFIPQHFEYTSGVVTTAQSFRLQHGRFEAKVRYNFVEGIFHSFYLCGDTQYPYISVFRNDPDEPASTTAVFYDAQGHKQQVAELGKLPLNRKFFIFSVEWTKDSIAWYVNGVKYMEFDNHLPDQPLYLAIASGVKVGQEPTTDARLEIDWVRCTSLEG